MDSPQQICSEIQTRIQGLFPLQADNLAGEMNALKRVLLENPTACNLLMDEDMGALCSNLRRITGLALASAAVAKEKAPPKEKKKVLSKEEFESALDDM